MPTNHTDMRYMNRLTVIEQIKKERLLSRSDIAANTGLNRATVSSIVDDLIKDGIVIEADWQDSKGGRPGKNLQIRPDGGYAIGIDIEVGFISIMATDLAGKVLFQREVPMSPPQSFAEILLKAERLIDEALEEGAARGIQPIGIGVAIPGVIDAKLGQVVLAPNLGWKDIPLRLMLTERFKLPIYVENDANYGAYGELNVGAAQGYSSMVYVSTGVGLGCGIILNGELYKGADGFAGEIGHTTLEINGKQCACGKRGCWETFVNQIAIHEFIEDLSPSAESTVWLQQEMVQNCNFSSILKAAEQGNEVAVKVLNHLGYYLGLGIGNIINTFNPQIVVLGGVYSIGYPLMKEVLERTVCESVFQPFSQSVKVVPAQCYSNSVLIGAVATVIEAKLRAST